MERNVRQIKNIRTWIVLLFIFIALLLVYTWCRVQYVQIGYEISNAVKINKKLTAHNNNLKIEHAYLKSPERIAKKAKENLGLIMPTAKQVIIIP